MCGGFTCSKNALISLNILYVVRYSFVCWENNKKIFLESLLLVFLSWFWISVQFFTIDKKRWISKTRASSGENLKNQTLHYHFWNTQKLGKIDNFLIFIQNQFVFVACGISADWRSCIWTSQLNGSKSANHWRHIRMWSYTYLHSIAGSGRSYSSSPGHPLLLYVSLH